MICSPELNRSLAMSETLKVTRKHPEFRSWLAAYPSGDTAHDEQVRRWPDHWAVWRYLAERYGKHEEERGAELAENAYQYLADGDGGLLDEAWSYITGTPEWAKLPPSSKLLFEILSALADEMDANGLPAGPKVVACHTLAIALFMSRAGWCPSKSTITDARKPLKGAGFTDVKPGEEWEKGKRSRATIYNLLPDDLRNLLLQNRTIPMSAYRDSSVASSVSRPQLSEFDRAVMRRTIKLPQMARKQEMKHHELVAEIAWFIRANGGQVKMPPAARRLADFPHEQEPESMAGSPPPAAPAEDLDRLLDPECFPPLPAPGQPPAGSGMLSVDVDEAPGSSTRRCGDDEAPEAGG